MGIYISGVKGLPEQVQENKNKIKEVEEQIEGIDFEAVRQLQGQVAENTQDINNIEASIGVQNQTINALGDRTTALERKTQLMSYNDDLSMTDFRNSIEVADDVYASSVRVQGDGSIVNTTQSGMHFKEGANDDVLTIANNDGATPHYLHFNGDGTIDIDGQPVGGGKKYVHNIRLFGGSNNTIITLLITNDSNEAIDTISKVKNYLSSNNFNLDSKLLVANGFTFYTESGNTRPMPIVGIYLNLNSNTITAFGGVVSTSTNKYIPLSIPVESYIALTGDTIVEA